MTDLVYKSLTYTVKMNALYLIKKIVATLQAILLIQFNKLELSNSLKVNHLK